MKDVIVYLHTKGGKVHPVPISQAEKLVKKLGKNKVIGFSLASDHKLHQAH